MALFGLNLVSILSVLFIAYILNSIWTLYSLFHPKRCQPEFGRNCLNPALFDENGLLPPVQLRVYTSLGSKIQSLGTEILRLDDLDLTEENLDQKVPVRLPSQTRNNGSLFVHAFLLPNKFGGDSPLGARWYLSQSTKITTIMVPVAATFQLMSDSDSSSQKTDETQKKRVPVTHFRSVLPLSVVPTPISFDWEHIPGEIGHLLRLEERTRKYYPIFYLNELSFRVKELVEVTPKTELVNLTINYKAMSIGKLRLCVSAMHSLDQLRSLGFSEKDVDEVKGIFADTNFYFLALTFFVAAIHLLLDFLAFKNDIQFWAGRRTMVGLSTRTLLWRCFSQSVIFFYLLDEETSLLVLIPTGVGTIIEFWKVTKAFKIRIVLSGGRPRIEFGSQSAAEVETESFDSQGMRYLGLILSPLCVCGAIYSLLYVPHKSWYSWFVQCLANGVYAFGFLFMLPQLFVNYKLKSVAHLPWRAFMYKAFNTFIDDMFAFIISMPTAHRLACFRDDIVFVVYLYQRYLYPVDRSRVNEFGESFEEEKKEK